MLKYNDIPNWIVGLEQEDLELIKKMTIYSGSLKELAKEYNVTYPTIRLKINKLIKKIKDSEKDEPDLYIEKIKALALNDKISIEVAKELIKDYQRLKK